MENYQTYLISYSAVMAVEPFGILFFFRFVTPISISLMIFMLNYAFTHILFSLRILLLAYGRNVSYAGFSIASQTNCCHGPYIGSVLLHMLFKKYAKKMP